MLKTEQNRLLTLESLLFPVGLRTVWHNSEKEKTFNSNSNIRNLIVIIRNLLFSRADTSQRSSKKFGQFWSQQSCEMFGLWAMCRARLHVNLEYWNGPSVRYQYICKSFSSQIITWFGTSGGTLAQYLYDIEQCTYPRHEPIWWSMRFSILLDSSTHRHPAKSTFNLQSIQNMIIRYIKYATI